MNWFQRMMYGRYGNDALNLALFCLALFLMLVLRIIAVFTGLFWLPAFSGVPVFVVIFRMFSRNLSRRSMENRTFQRIFSRVRGFFTGKRRGQSGNPYYGSYQSNVYSHPASPKTKRDKSYKYYRCPNCRIHLRVPKGKGKICITCPKCHVDFIKKT